MEWKIYEDVFKESLRLSHILQALGVEMGSFVGICGENSAEWMVADFACVMNHFVSVGCMKTWSSDFLYISNHSEMCALICDEDSNQVLPRAYSV